MLEEPLETPSVVGTTVAQKPDHLVNTSVSGPEDLSKSQPTKVEVVADAKVSALETAGIGLLTQPGEQELITESTPTEHAKMSSPELEATSKPKLEPEPAVTASALPLDEPRSKTVTGPKSESLEASIEPPDEPETCQSEALPSAEDEPSDLSPDSKAILAEISSVQKLLDEISTTDTILQEVSESVNKEY